MAGPLVGVAGRGHRRLLLANWSICRATADHAVSDTPPEDASWIPLRELMPVAAALRELKQWSLDGPARRFDAEDWWYRLAFDAPTATDQERLILGFDGLATLARVWLNGKALLTSANMFVAHEIDVSGALEATGNELLIRFGALDAQLAVRRKRPRWRAPMVEHQQLRWFRTTLLGRTPGWSPPAAVVGPWRDVWLERRGTIDLANPSVTARVQGTTGIVQCTLPVVPGTAIESALLQLTRGARVSTHPLACAAGNAADAEYFSGELQIDDVELWWPHTHGEPALYHASLQIRPAGAEQDIALDLGQVGFRTMALDTTGGNFSLSVNGVPIFCRGACWTPLDPVTLRASAADTHAAIAQARTAGMNMLRIAGTMVYEDGRFFDACDELGILVWQDFMFANMDYPADDPAFAESVSVEVRQQLQRIQPHACAAVLCGNSEVEQQAAMWGAPRDAWQSPLFGETLARLCAEIVPDVPYWPSSAHGGSFPHQASQGSTSYYGVGAYLRTLDDARSSELKFATECLAFANVPGPSALERMPGGLATRVHHPGWKARSPRDLGAGWDFDDVRDHYLDSFFKTHPPKLRYSDHDKYLTLSRIVTGEVMAASFAQWRRPASVCGGALVLFLRDLWAGAGWGLVDDAGVPKACYHYVRRTLQPLAVLLSDEGVNGLFVHVINERAEPRQLELELTAWRDGDVLVTTGKKNLNMPAHSAQTLASLDLFEHFMDLTHAYRFGPMICDVIIATLRDIHGSQLAQTFFFPGDGGIRPDPDAGLSAQARMLDDHTAEVTVRTKRLAQAVHFDVHGFEASDEYFHMAPHSEVCVTLRASRQLSFAGFVHTINSSQGVRIELLR
jgi:beta-mannosidase